LPTIPDPAGNIRHTGSCLQPVLLRGRADYIDGGTGELLHRYTTVYQPGGVLPIACKTRRASRCPPCAEVYRADTYQLIRAGLTGGKGIPATVADHPCVFVTLTAPSFGLVHARREKDGRVLACRPRRRGRTCPHGIRMSCTEKHARDDDRLGEPLCPDCYDYTGSVLFNVYASELWRRFSITLRRTLARQAGLTGKAFAAQVRVSYAKVAEYQRRGVVHFHTVIRLDGPAGPTTVPPAWTTPTLLTNAIDQAARAVNVTTPTAPEFPARTLAWGRELDIRPVTTVGEVTDAKVAAYVAKYATKAAECTGTLDRRITPADRLADLPVRDHARRHIAECLRLAKLPSSASCAWPRGHTCSGSAATSPPRAAPIPSPSARFAPPGPLTSADTPSPPACNQTSTPAPRSSSPTGTTPDGGTRSPTCWPPISHPSHRGEVRRAPAPADRPRSRRRTGHLPQQALRAASHRRHRLGPHRWISPHPPHRPGGLRLQAARRKDRRLMPDTHRKPRRNTPRLRDGVMKRGSTWSYVIRVKDPETGISKPRWVGGFATEQEAKAARDEARVNARQGQYIDRNSITVAAYLDQWLEAHAVEVKPKTLQDYRHLINRHVRPQVGDLRLQAITPARITKLYRDLAISGGPGRYGPVPPHRRVCPRCIAEGIS
jgi:hypothetical protein